jgi:hypothetical protein
MLTHVRIYLSLLHPYKNITMQTTQNETQYVILCYTSYLLHTYYNSVLYRLIHLLLLLHEYTE